MIRKILNKFKLFGLKFRFKNNVTIASEYFKSLTERASYSQAGEDRLVEFVMTFFAKINPVGINYLDIGSNYPHANNNTYYYFLKGGHGVLVEPNSKLCELSKRIRPTDEIINAGIKFDSQDKATYFSFEDSGINTFDETRANEMQSKGHKLIDKKEIELVSINKIFEKYFSDKKVDYMSIDAESVDFRILKTIEFEKHRPKIICVENDKRTMEYGAQNGIIDFLKTKDYMYIADSSINFIFLAKEEFSVNEKYR